MDVSFPPLENVKMFSVTSFVEREKHREYSRDYKLFLLFCFERKYVIVRTIVLVHLPVRSMMLCLVSNVKTKAILFPRYRCYSLVLFKHLPWQK